MNEMDDMNYQVPNYGQPEPPKKGNGAGTAFGIISIVLAVVGGICFGVIASVIALVIGVIGVILSINAKKATNNQVGGAGFICSVIGIVFAVVFTIGCGIAGIATIGSYGGYGCYGCVGGSIKMANDISNGAQDMMDLYKELEGMEDFDMEDYMDEYIEDYMDEYIDEQNDYDW